MKHILKRNIVHLGSTGGEQIWREKTAGERLLAMIPELKVKKVVGNTLVFEGDLNYNYKADTSYKTQQD